MRGLGLGAVRGMTIARALRGRTILPPAARASGRVVRRGVVCGVSLAAGRGSSDVVHVVCGVMLAAGRGLRGVAHVVARVHRGGRLEVVAARGRWKLS